MTEASFSVSPSSGHVIARLKGEIDFANAAEIGERLLDSTPGTAAGLVLDLADVKFIDSAGVRMLFDVVRRLEGKRQAIVISVPEPSPVRILLKLTNLQEAVPVHLTVDECIASLNLIEGSTGE